MVEKSPSTERREKEEVVEAASDGPGELLDRTFRDNLLLMIFGIVGVVDVALAAWGTWSRLADRPMDTGLIHGGVAELEWILYCATVGVSLLAVAWGYWRRRRWAWFGALVFTGLAVVGFVFGLVRPLWGESMRMDLLSLVIGFVLLPHVWTRREAFTRARNGR